MTPTEVVTDAAPVYPAVLDELIPSAWHHVERYANNPIEAVPQMRAAQRRWTGSFERRRPLATKVRSSACSAGRPARSGGPAVPVDQAAEDIHTLDPAGNRQRVTVAGGAGTGISSLTPWCGWPVL